jgi:nitrogen fixation/metabolism regulation signal transduction histidine kinase
MPFYNNRDDLSGYVNLPYFSRQTELQKEISGFLVAFVNIYTLFLLLGLFAAVIISGYITAPLRMLREKIRKLRFGGGNEKIEWKRKDEIGRLVEEYNRMLDELALSAEKLAVSERESAWREMARQVAHEIKNPLTPMKLSTQHLLRAREEKAADWDERFKRYAEALIVQIDTLSAIAGEFSDFAKMPAPVIVKIRLADLIGSALSLYSDLPGISVNYRPEPGDERSILADEKQALRVLTNLLNNAVQAIGNSGQGILEISVETSDNQHHIHIKDNGEGIPDALAGRIFQPNFTTKSGGTGLGLAIAREIVRSLHGDITFTSRTGAGSTFTVSFPAAT